MLRYERWSAWWIAQSMFFIGALLMAYVVAIALAGSLFTLFFIVPGFLLWRLAKQLLNISEEFRIRYEIAKLRGEDGGAQE